MVEEKIKQVEVVELVVIENLLEQLQVVGQASPLSPAPCSSSFYPVSAQGYPITVGGGGGGVGGPAPEHLVVMGSQGSNTFFQV